MPNERARFCSQLLDRAREGDPVAWRRLFRATRPRVVALVRRHVDEPAAIDDVVQEVFVAAFGGLRRFRGQASVETWLHRIAINTAYSWRMRRHRRRRHDSEVPRWSPAAATAPDEWLYARQLQRCFEGALAQMPAEHREAFAAHRMEGRSLRRLSRELGVAISPLSYRASRAELRMRSVLTAAATA